MMRVVTQNVVRASVIINQTIVASIEKGIVWFVGFTHDDNPIGIEKMIEKLVHLRSLPDAQGKTNRSVIDEQASLLVVPNFTLYGSIVGSRRPSFTQALPPSAASSLFDHLKKYLFDRWPNSQFGVFGEDMKIHVENDGPFTMVHDSEAIL
jgi:D-tyrosyl-tRNA(Tyr) deacylase